MFGSMAKPSARIVLLVIPLLALAGCGPTRTVSDDDPGFRPDRIAEVGNGNFIVRIVEFTPKGSPDTTCVWAQGGEERLACFPKAGTL